MANTIITKNSSTASAVPTSGDLVQGELAVNVTDKRLFTENASGTVVEVGTNPSSLTLPNGTANGVAYLNGSKVLTSGSALTFDGTQLYTTGDFRVNNDKEVRLGANATYYGSLKYDSATGNTVLSGRVDSYPLQFNIGGSEKMRLTSTGLGIGTSSPTDKLMVAGAITATSAGTSFTAGSPRALVDWNTGISQARVGAINGTGSANSLGFYVGTTEKMRLDASGNLGLGVTPSAWGSSYPAMQIGYGGSVYSRSTVADAISLFGNTYRDSTGTFRYIQSSTATQFNLYQGGFSWQLAASGTAGNAISFTQAMTLNASGNLLVGNTGQWSSERFGITGSSSSQRFLYARTTSNGHYVSLGTDGTLPYFEFGNGSGLAFKDGSTERLRIDSSGNLLVGTTSALGKLTVRGSSGITIGSSLDSGTVGDAYYGNVYATAQYLARWEYRGGFVGSITTTGTATAYNTTSDYRLKEDWVAVADASTRVNALKPVNFAWKATGDRVDGFLAHELAEVVPEAVTGEKDAVDDEGNPVYQGIDQSKLVPLLTAALQEALEEINTLKARLDAAGL